MSDSAPAPSSSGRGRFVASVAGYMAMRFGLLAVVAALVWGVGRLIGVHVPVVVALLFAGVASMPLSWLLFKQFNVNVGADMAQADQRRRSERAALRAQLANDNADAAHADGRGTPPQE